MLLSLALREYSDQGPPLYQTDRQGVSVKGELDDSASLRRVHQGGLALIASPPLARTWTSSFWGRVVGSGLARKGPDAIAFIQRSLLVLGVFRIVVFSYSKHLEITQM